MSGFLNLGTSDAWAGSFLGVGTVLCIAACLAASLASNLQMPVAFPLLSSCDNHKHLQTLSMSLGVRMAPV